MKSMAMKSMAMKSMLLLALACAANAAFARWPEYIGFWVVGNRATNKCEIVTTNPVIDADGRVIWFGSGPYKSLDDAKLARSTIRECPKVDDD